MIEDKNTRFTWNISPEQIIEIKCGNVETLNKVYFDNYTRFKRCVHRILRKSFSLRWFDDCLNQIYVDLSKFCFLNDRRFYYSILTMCSKVVYGSACRVIYYDEPVCANATYADFLGVEDKPFSETLEENQRVLSFIQKSLSDSDERDYMLSIAFKCQNFKGLFDYAYKQNFTT